MGGIDLTFSGTEHPLLHLLPLTPAPSPPLVDFFYLYGELLSLPLSCLRERCFFSHSRIPAGLPRYPRGCSPPFSESTRPSEDALNDGRRRTWRNWKRRLRRSFVSLVSLLSFDVIALYSDFLCRSTGRNLAEETECRRKKIVRYAPRVITRTRSAGRLQYRVHNLEVINVVNSPRLISAIFNSLWFACFPSSMPANMHLRKRITCSSVEFTSRDVAIYHKNTVIFFLNPSAICNWIFNREIACDLKLRLPF